MQRYDSAFTMFVYLKGIPAIEYFLGLKDASIAANDSAGAAVNGEVSSAVIDVAAGHGERFAGGASAAPVIRRPGGGRVVELRRRTDP